MHISIKNLAKAGLFNSKLGEIRNAEATYCYIAPVIVVVCFGVEVATIKTEAVTTKAGANRRYFICPKCKERRIKLILGKRGLFCRDCLARLMSNWPIKRKMYASIHWHCSQHSD